MKRFFFGIVIFLLVVGTPSASAEEFYCEVLAVEGTVTMTRGSDEAKTLQEGDLLQAEDAIEVGASSYVDIAYDKDWNNVSRIEENSKIVIKTIDPASIELSEGGVYAKLKSLPKDSTFEVKTPTAIASVRGTEYRTTVVSGETEIFNLSESNVYVYSFDEAGSRQDTPVVLANSQKTQVIQRGRPPVAPRAMEQRDFQPAERIRQGVERKIQENVARGRVGKIQDVKAIERFREERKSGGNALRSDEGARRDPSKREPLQPMTGDDARDRVKQMTGGDQEPKENKFNEGRSVFAGEKSERSFEGRGLGQPYFPSDENSRSGGPEPAGFPSDRWKSGYEKDVQGSEPDHNFQADRVRADGNMPGEGARMRDGGPSEGGQGVARERMQARVARNGGGEGAGGGNRPNNNNKGSGGSNRGGGRPGPRR